MKNARNMFSKNTLNTENHRKTVSQLPHNQAATNVAKSKPAALVKHCCADPEHRTISTPTLYHCTPNTCTIVPPTSYHCTPTSYHCTRYIVPSHPIIVPLHLLDRTIAPTTSYHCTLYFVPLYPLYRTIVPRISYYRTPFVVPLHFLYRTIATLHVTIAPATSYDCTPTSYHCTPYVVPLYRLHRTIVPSYCIASPYHCAVWTAPSHLHFAPPYLRFVPFENHHCFWNLIK